MLALNKEIMMFKYIPKYLAFFASVASALLLSACAMQRQEAVEPVAVSDSSTSRSTALGTQWGEEMTSSVQSVNLKRVSNTPIDVVEIRYAANQVRGSSIQTVNIANGRIQMSILNEHNAKWPLTQDGKYLYLKGKEGERYQLHYRNLSNNTYEIVATVDGLDVLNGQPGSVRNPGYVLRPNSTLTIQGFRLSKDEVAAFRFSSTNDAYASNTPAGDAHNIGVIGTAVFVLDAPAAVNQHPHQESNAFPADDLNNGYAPPPNYQY